MTEFWIMLVVAALAWLAYGAGLFVEKRSERKNLTCGCKHHLSEHKIDGECNVIRVELGKYDEIGRYHCPCVIYTGNYPDDWALRVMRKKGELEA